MAQLRLTRSSAKRASTSATKLLPVVAGTLPSRPRRLPRDCQHWPYATLIQPRLAGLPPELELKVSQYATAWSTTIPAAALATAAMFLLLRVLGVERMRSALFAGLFYAGTPVVIYSLNLTNGQNIVEIGAAPDVVVRIGARSVSRGA